MKSKSGACTGKLTLEADPRSTSGLHGLRERSRESFRYPRFGLYYPLKLARSAQLEGSPCSADLGMGITPSAAGRGRVVGCRYAPIQPEYNGPSLADPSPGFTLVAYLRPHALPCGGGPPVMLLRPISAIESAPLKPQSRNGRNSAPCQ